MHDNTTPISYTYTLPFPTPYGYIKNPEKPTELIFNEKISYYLQFLFDEYFRGESIAVISSRLTNIHAPTPTAIAVDAGRQKSVPTKIDYWIDETIKYILRSEIYSGKYVCHSKWLTIIPPGLPSDNPPLFPEDYFSTKPEYFWIPCPAYITYEQHQRILETLGPRITSKKKAKKQHKSASTKRSNDSCKPGHLFNKRLICAHCNRLMFFRNNTFTCSSNLVHTENPCNPVRYSVDDIEKNVYPFLFAEAALAKEVYAIYEQKYESTEFKAYSNILKNAFTSTLSSMHDLDSESSLFKNLQLQLKSITKELDLLYHAFSRKNLWLNLYKDLPDDFTFDPESSLKYINGIYLDQHSNMKVKFFHTSHRDRILYYLDLQHASDFVAALDAPKASSVHGE